MNMFFMIDSSSSDSCSQHMAMDSGMEETSAIAIAGYESESTISAATDTGGSGSWTPWLGVGLSICIGLLLWKIIKKISKDIQTIHERLLENKRALGSALETIDALKNEIKVLSDNVNSIKLRSVLEPSSPKAIEPFSSPVAQNAELTEQMEQIKSEKIVRYATLQSPNELGVLRFSERSMVETPSSQKMFILEIDMQAGVGSYRINPAAVSLILADMQLFKEFVKPFTFSGNLMNAKIQDKVSGKIVKKGNFWVVEELLDIIIN